MNYTQAKKQVIILHPCHFIRQGIWSLLPSVCRVFDTADLEQSKRWLLTHGQTDLVIISLPGVNYSMLSVIDLIDELGQTNCRVLVMLDTLQSKGLQHYLAGSGEQVKVIAWDSPLPLLTRQIEQMVQGEVLPLQQTVTDFSQAYPERLSVLEFEVLETLLAGKTPRQLANQLALREKEVSYYKCRALAKLGIKNIHSLLPGFPLL